LGAGIGTLIAGGNMGEAAANAVGFGLGGAALQQGLGGLFGGAGAEAAAGGVGQPLSALRGAAGMMGQPQQQPPIEVPQADTMRPQPRPQAEIGGQGMIQPLPPVQLPQQASLAQPFQQQAMQGGIANAIPGMGMPSVDQMIANLGPNAPFAQQHLRGFG
jgi:hypothetical protein